MNVKSYPAEVKAVDEEAGTFEALVSVFGNVDLVGDRVMPGAFEKSLERWRTIGAPIPVTWSHDWSIDGFIGSADPKDVTETDRGLVVKGRLDLTDDRARKAHRLLKDRLVRNFSFSYEVSEAESKDGVRELKELELYEVGPTLVGANRATELLAVKSDHGAEEAKADVDNSTWDGNAAMSACDAAACYRAICAGRRAGDPDLRQSWALPHHKRPGAAPNADGVRNALSRLPQTQGLTNRAQAESHLEDHMRVIRKSKSLEALRRARTAIDEAIAEQEGASEEDEDGNGEEPNEAKPEDQLDPEAFLNDPALVEAESLLDRGEREREHQG